MREVYFRATIEMFASLTPSLSHFLLPWNKLVKLQLILVTSSTRRMLATTGTSIGKAGTGREYYLNSSVLLS